MDFNYFGTISGFAACALVVLLTIFRQRRFELADIGAFAAGFFAGTNIPPALFLCAYALSPDPPDIATKLHGLERFVSFAGLSLLFVSLVSISGLCRNAYVVVAPSE